LPTRAMLRDVGYKRTAGLWILSQHIPRQRKQDDRKQLKDRLLLFSNELGLLTSDS